MSILKVTDIKAKDGVSALSIADGTGVVGANKFANLAGTGAPDFPNGLTLAGNTITGNVTGVTLDDYEEGTWTPTNNGDPTGVISSALGYYRKIGSIVFCSFSFTVDTSFTNSKIGGLPFPVFDIGPARNGLFLQAASSPYLAFIVESGTDTLLNYKISDNTSPAIADTTRCSLTYITSS